MQWDRGTWITVTVSALCLLWLAYFVGKLQGESKANERRDQWDIKRRLTAIEMHTREAQQAAKEAAD